MNRNGFALLLVLLVVAAVELITLSTLALATHESVAVSAQERRSVALRAAEASLNRLIRAWPSPAVDSLRVSESVVVRDPSGVFITVERSTWGLYHATAVTSAGAGWMRAASVLEVLDYERGIREAAQAMAPFPAVQTACLPPPVPAYDDSVRFVAADYAFAGLSWRELASIADTIVSGGYPVKTDSLGKAIGQFVYARGSLALPSARMAGVLVADGGLAVPTGAEFEGVIVGRGAVILADGAQVTGGIVADAANLVIGNTPPLYSSCAVGQALLGLPASRRLASTYRRFIPVF